MSREEKSKGGLVVGNQNDSLPWEADVSIYKADKEAETELARIKAENQRHYAWLVVVVVGLTVAALHTVPVANNICWWKENNQCVRMKEKD